MSSSDDRDVSLVILGDTRARRRWPRPTRRIALGLAGIVLAGGIGAWWWAQDGLPDGTAYVVDGQQTSTADLRREVATLRSMYGVEVPSGRDEVDRFWKDAAKASVVGRIVEEAADEMKIVIDEKQARTALDEYVAQLFGPDEDARAAFVAELADAGTSEPAVLAEITRQLTLQELYQRVIAPIDTPEDEELQKLFARRGCTLTVPEARGLRNIVVTTRDEAQGVVDRLAAGEDFAALAKVRSADESSRDAGGDLGQVYRGQLDEAYGDAAFAAPPSGVFGPVESQFGWNVGQVTSVVPPVEVSQADGITAMRSLVLSERRSERWGSWLSERIRDADVEYADRYRPKDPDALPTAMSGLETGVNDRTCPTLTSTKG